jgi:hypothetical protein
MPASQRAQWKSVDDSLRLDYRARQGAAIDPDRRVAVARAVAPGRGPRRLRWRSGTRIYEGAGRVKVAKGSAQLTRAHRTLIVEQWSTRATTVARFVSSSNLGASRGPRSRRSRAGNAPNAATRVCRCMPSTRGAVPDAEHRRTRGTALSRGGASDPDGASTSGGAGPTSGCVPVVGAMKARAVNRLPALMLTPIRLRYSSLLSSHLPRRPEPAQRSMCPSDRQQQAAGVGRTEHLFGWPSWWRRGPGGSVRLAAPS